MRRIANTDLQALPNDEAVLAALGVCLVEEHYHYGATAQHVAQRLGVQPARRAGRGAVKGSWSGYMAPALRIVPRLRALQRKGLVASYYDSTYRTITRYYLTEKGKAALGG